MTISIVGEIAGAPTLVLVLADLKEVELHPVRELAESSWFSESGAVPISWNGAQIHCTSLIRA